MYNADLKLMSFSFQTFSSSLIDRRNQWSKEEEDRRKKLKEAEIPSGHRLMSEQERTDTLEKARQSNDTNHCILLQGRTHIIVMAS